MEQGQVCTEGLNTPQLKLTCDVLAMTMDKLIQDDMQRDEFGKPLPAEMQEDLYIRQAMKLLNYK